jgi:hypothetical protein
MKGTKMKAMNSICRYVVVAGLVMAAVSCAWASDLGAAGGKGGASQLMKQVKTVEDLQSIEAGDTLVMSCPKCKDSYAKVVEKSFKGMNREELETVVTHLCPTCDTKIVAVGPGKSKMDKLSHTCKACGSEDAFCCVIKKGGAPTSGMGGNDAEKK